jgi:uncharacterized protein (DUF433 family)
VSVGVWGMRAWGRGSLRVGCVGACGSGVCGVSGLRPMVRIQALQQGGTRRKGPRNGWLRKSTDPGRSVLVFPMHWLITRSRFNMDYRDIITVEPGKRGGKPCIRGMRITVYDVLDYLASGMTSEEILEDFPYLTKEDLQACLQYAAERERYVRVGHG